MSIREQVLEAMSQFAAVGATYAEVHRVLRGKATEQQVRVSLYRLSETGYLRCEPGGPASGGCGKAPGRFFLREQRLVRARPPGRPKRRENLPSYPVSSPWNMADGIDIECWPPKFEGGRVYQQLGPWNVPDPMEGVKA